MSFKQIAERLRASIRSMWSGFGRLAEPLKPQRSYDGFRLARTGKHKDTMLTRHEQVRKPAGSKLWKKCPLKEPCWETGR